MSQRDGSPEATVTKDGRVLVPQARGGALANWPKGVSGNPGGGRKAGAFITEWINKLMERNVGEESLKRIMRRKKTPAALKIAVNRVLAMMERPDLADFEPLIDGQVSLRELRAQGLDTAHLKKWKPRKTRTTRRKEGEEDIIEEVTEAEIELHDRSLPNFDKTLDRTDGKPSETVQLNVDGEVTHSVQLELPPMPGMPLIETTTEELPSSGE